MFHDLCTCGIGIAHATLVCLYCRYDECVEGGVSTVLDAYPVVEELRMRHPKQFDTLTKVPVRFKNNTLIG